MLLETDLSPNVVILRTTIIRRRSGNERGEVVRADMVIQARKVNTQLLEGDALMNSSQLKLVSEKRRYVVVSTIAEYQKSRYVQH